ncbi:MAG: metal-dependent hydrolase [Cyclobacteriaceae bacterium]
MDSITHIALGACLGELYGRKELGKKALWIGAAAQSLPDIDFMASFWLSPAEDLIAHRGFTHSIFFVVVTSAGLALASSRWRSLATFNFKRWLWFFCLQIGTHILLDAFNAYGTAWFEPFSHHRVSFNTLFVADPFFTIPLAVACFTLLLRGVEVRGRAWWSWGALFMSIAYLAYGVANKLYIQDLFHQSLNEKGISYHQTLVTPTPANVWLWFMVAEADEGLHVTHQSVFDAVDYQPLTFFPRNKEVLNDVNDQLSVQQLIRFSEGFYVVRKYEGAWVFNDLRFGQMLGWDDPQAPFVFYYDLDDPNNNHLLIQRGRFAGWNMEAAGRFIDRIRGIKPPNIADPARSELSENE